MTQGRFVTRFAAAAALFVLLAACKEDCLAWDAAGKCEQVCTQWQGKLCVHSCKRGLPCD